MTAEDEIKKLGIQQGADLVGLSRLTGNRRRLGSISASGSPKKDNQDSAQVTDVTVAG